MSLFDLQDFSVLISLLSGLIAATLATFAYYSSQRLKRQVAKSVEQQSQISAADGETLYSALEQCQDQVLIVEPGLPAMLDFEEKFIELARQGVTVRLLVTHVQASDREARSDQINALFEQRYAAIKSMVSKSENSIFVRSQANKVQSPIILVDDVLFVFPFHNFFDYSATQLSGSPMFSISDHSQIRRFQRAFEQRWDVGNKLDW
ncbi:MAG: hypothetical protein AAF667_06610 [Pseudomonadota bacterium]